MIPVNQVFLGGADPLLGTSPITGGIDELLLLLEKQRLLLENAKLLRMNQALQVLATQLPALQQKLIWDEIDLEIEPMTDEQKLMLFLDADYADNYNALLLMVLAEILTLVKGRIESSQEGKDLLSNQLKIVKKLKSKIIELSNREMEMFKRFREYSKIHPNVTYEEFIKSI